MGSLVNMTYLQLAQKLVEKCGISGNGPTTVVGQTGELKRVVGWINEAYLQIQEMRPNWSWMTGNVSFTTVAQQATYTPAQCGIADFAEWKLSSRECTFRSSVTSVGFGSEIFMNYIDYEAWRNYYQYGNLRTSYGRPLFVAVTPDKSLGFGLVPDSVGYTIVGEYFKAPTELLLDADVPLLPGRFHMLIVYLAMTYYGAYENAPDAASEGQRMYASMLRRLNQDQLPEMIFGGPLG